MLHVDCSAEVYNLEMALNENKFVIEKTIKYTKILAKKSLPRSKKIQLKFLAMISR